MKKRFEFRAKSPGYELVDTSTTPPTAFAMVIGKHSAKNTVDTLNKFHDALEGIADMPTESEVEEMTGDEAVDALNEAINIARDAMEELL